MKFNKAFKVFTLNLFFVTLVQVNSTIVGKVFHLPNIFLSHYYFLLQFIFLSFFYMQLLKGKWIYLISGASMLFFITQYAIDHDMYHKFNQTGMLVSYLVLILYAIIYLYKCLSFRGEFVLVTIGILTYLLSSSLIFASSNTVLSIDKAVYSLLFDINKILFFAYQVLIFLEWFKNYRFKPR